MTQIFTRKGNKIRKEKKKSIPLAPLAALEFATHSPYFSKLCETLFSPAGAILGDKVVRMVRNLGVKKV